VDVDVKKCSSGSSKSRVGPQFDLVGTATLRLEDAGEEVRCHELYLEDAENDRLPALFGQFCCRLAVQPYCRYSTSAALKGQ
jgi:hypothetical protein